MIRAIQSKILYALTDRKGVTAAEYAVLAVGIVLLVAIAAAALGSGISNTFSKVVSSLG